MALEDWSIASLRGNIHLGVGYESTSPWEKEYNHYDDQYQGLHEIIPREVILFQSWTKVLKVLI